ncbi:hypothetical protein ACFC8N_42735 [Streptomyces sp. NPDC055966]|uniref:hypothetical protein n=1 Tax=Streptomyces sp. NPDC055966 TaxID=3345669 RepID=UPI0035DC1AA0
MTIAPSILATYTDNIAFVAETSPAQTPDEFVNQLETAARNLTAARINGAEDLETAATYLIDAIHAKGTERQVLTKQAVSYLANTRDMVDEYRAMVGD